MSCCRLHLYQMDGVFDNTPSSILSLMSTSSSASHQSAASATPRQKDVPSRTGSHNHLSPLLADSQPFPFGLGQFEHWSMTQHVRENHESDLRTSNEYLLKENGVIMEQKIATYL